MTRLHPAQLLKEATFEFRTFEEATKVSHFLAQACPNPTLADIALSELFTNAIEHGNLNLSFKEKTQLQQENRWLPEIERRLTLPEYQQKKVTVLYTRKDKELRFKIIDEGKGFDWKKHKKESSSKEELASHGRGLAIITKAAFERVEYLGAGNEVLCVISLHTS